MQTRSVSPVYIVIKTFFD